MDKKKFYIILLSIVVVFLIGYLLIYLNGSLRGYKVDPAVDDSDARLQEEIRMKSSASPQLMSASGEIVSVDENSIKVELDLDDEKVVVEVSPGEGGVELVSGNYNEDGGLENREVTQTTVDNIKEGDNVSFRFKDFVSVDNLEDETFQVDYIRVNPKGNPEK